MNLDGKTLRADCPRTRQQVKLVVNQQHIMQHMNMILGGDTSTLIHSSTQHDLSEKRIRGLLMKYIHYKVVGKGYKVES